MRTKSALVLAVMCLAGCAGRYEDRIAELEEGNARLESERAAAQAALEDLEIRMEIVAAYQEALEDLLVKKGIDRSLLLEEYGKAQESLAKAKEDVELMKGKLEATRKMLQTSQDELEASLGDLAQKMVLLDEMKKKQEQAQERLALLKDMIVRFKSLIEAGKLEVTIRNNKMLIWLPSEVLFASGSAKLSKEGKETLAEVAGVLVTIEGREFLVAGHTDDEPKKVMSFEDNWELSTERALAVVRFLVDSGMSSSAVGAAGYGQFQPVAENSTPEGKAKNRRIEIILTPNLDELPDLTHLDKEITK